MSSACNPHYVVLCDERSYEGDKSLLFDGCCEYKAWLQNIDKTLYANNGVFVVALWYDLSAENRSKM